MKLIFNKDDKGTDELKALIPYVDADLAFENLEPDVKTATNDIIKLIGKELYQKAVELYEGEDDLNELQTEFLKSIRYPIAVNAYRLFAPTNDLAHTNTGRKMRSSAEEKNPFEWMIDRDNAAQEKRYFRSLDDLIFFLDSQTISVESEEEEVDPEEEPSEEDIEAAELLEFENAIADMWRASDAFKLSQKLFIRTVDEFDNVFPIQSRLLLIKLSPGIEDCETQEIYPRLGKTKFDALKAQLESGEPITDPDDIKLLKMIKRACAFYAMSWSMISLSVNLYPEGVLQHYTSDRATTQSKKPALNIEPKSTELAFKVVADRALKAIEEFLSPAADPEDFEDNIQPLGDCDDKYFNA
jgi:hypothetical protein